MRVEERLFSSLHNCEVNCTSLRGKNYEGRKFLGRVFLRPNNES